MTLFVISGNKFDDEAAKYFRDLLVVKFSKILLICPSISSFHHRLPETFWFSKVTENS